jgi:hypothetical protein
MKQIWQHKTFLTEERARNFEAFCISSGFITDFIFIENGFKVEYKKKHTI